MRRLLPYLRSVKTCWAFTLGMFLMNNVGCHQPIATFLQPHPTFARGQYYHCSKCGKLVPKFKQHACECNTDLPCHGYQPTAWRAWECDWSHCPSPWSGNLPPGAPAPGSPVFEEIPNQGRGPTPAPEPAGQAPIPEVDTTPVPRSIPSVEPMPEPTLPRSVEPTPPIEPVPPRLNVPITPEPSVSTPQAIEPQFEAPPTPPEAKIEPKPVLEIQPKVEKQASTPAPIVPAPIRPEATPKQVEKKIDAKKSPVTIQTPAPAIIPLPRMTAPVLTETKPAEKKSIVSKPAVSEQRSPIITIVPQPTLEPTRPIETPLAEKPPVIEKPVVEAPIVEQPAEKQPVVSLPTIQDRKPVVQEIKPVPPSTPLENDFVPGDEEGYAPIVESPAPIVTRIRPAVEKPVAGPEAKIVNVPEQKTFQPEVRAETKEESSPSDRVTFKPIPPAPLLPPSAGDVSKQVPSPTKSLKPAVPVEQPVQTTGISYSGKLKAAKPVITTAQSTNTIPVTDRRR